MSQMHRSFVFILKFCYCIFPRARLHLHVFVCTSRLKLRLFLFSPLRCPLDGSFGAVTSDPLGPPKRSPSASWWTPRTRFSRCPGSPAAACRGAWRPSSSPPARETPWARRGSSPPPTPRRSGSPSWGPAAGPPRSAQPACGGGPSCCPRWLWEPCLRPGSPWRTWWRGPARRRCWSWLCHRCCRQERNHPPTAPSSPGATSPRTNPVRPEEELPLSLDNSGKPLHFPQMLSNSLTTSRCQGDRVCLLPPSKASPKYSEWFPSRPPPNCGCRRILPGKNNNNYSYGLQAWEVCRARWDWTLTNISVLSDEPPGEEAHGQSCTRNATSPRATDARKYVCREKKNATFTVFTWFAHTFFPQHSDVGIHCQTGSMCSGGRVMLLL